uniref:DUF148 domain-containing protein n=1 Tax=Syphacia muris TaxID=451379 RepID=A0A0N5AYR4_9BILA
MFQNNVLSIGLIILGLIVTDSYANSIFLRHSSDHDDPSSNISPQQLLEHWHPRQLFRSQLLLSRTRRMISEDSEDVTTSLLSEMLKDNETLSDSLRAIISNRSLTKRELAAKLKEWASEQNSTFNELFQKYLEKVMSWTTEFRSKVAAATSLSPEAREALNEIAENSENLDQSYDQQTAKNAEILERQPGKVQFEIYQFYMQY